MRRALMGTFGYIYASVTYIFMKFGSRNKIVVCDRYFYQFFLDLFGDWSEKIVRFFPKPDISFFLDGDLDLFYSRMDNSVDASVDRNYYTDVLNLCRRIAQKYDFIQIDANLERKKINDIIYRAIEEKMGAKHNE